MVMTTDLSISVVIATYQRARLLAECLSALRAQDYRAGDEVIVVDNASGDATAAILAEAARDFPVPVRILHEAVPGKPPALRTGIAAATGKILALTDDDVLVETGWIATIRRLFDDPSLALVGGRVDPRWEADVPRWLQLEQHGRYSRMTSPLALLHYGETQPLGARTAVGANLAVRRDVFEAVGGLSPDLGRFRGTLLCGEDRDLCRRVAAAGYRSEYRPELIVRHWVPAARTRMSYYLRWFYWSGVTNALIEAHDSRAPRVSHFLRRLLTAPVAAVARLLSGRPADAAAVAADAAFAAGYTVQRLVRPAALHLRRTNGAN
jgi:glucosyl-dolichyl phosphate glucuronosyltransferase